jgi:hypothetical protein
MMFEAGIIAAAIKKVMRRFRQAGATSPATAQSLPEIGLRRSMIFRRLLARGVVVHAGNDRYYLDEDAVKAFVEQLRVKGFVAGGIALVLFVIWWVVWR